MMLKPGCRFVVAPRFHVPGEWSTRLLIGSGVREIEGLLRCRDSWRAPTAEELSVLVGESDQQLGEVTKDCIAFFQLPDHLGSEWWSLLEASADALGSGQLPGFESYASRVGELLNFKGLALPDDARFSVTLSNPAENTRGSGLLGNGSARWGVVNLGDEDTFVVLINLSFEQLAGELRDRFPDEPLPATRRELGERFLRRCGDYPPARLRLGPGQGCRFPETGVIHASYPGDRASPDVLLLIEPDNV